MKKVFITVVVLLLIVFAGFKIVNNYKYVLIPPNKDIKQYLPLNKQTISPIHLTTDQKMDVFADLGNEMPRVMAFDKNGNLFVSLTTSGKIIALIDEDNDLKVDRKIEVLSGLKKPHGIVFDSNYLYVAETDKVSRYLYDSNSFAVLNKELLFELPTGGRHFTRTIGISQGKLYTSVGSSCDVCVEKDNRRASILVSNLDGSGLKVLASGLRNSVFFDFDSNGSIWATEMGRDNLGDNQPPDEVNIINTNVASPFTPQNYGWPNCYGLSVKDLKFKGEVLCDQTVYPVFEIPAHSAPLGIRFDNQGNLLIALHGSWNSTKKVGYKIIKLTVFADKVAGYDDYITGFLAEADEVLGRPVDLIFDSNNNLFISDDSSGMIYVLEK